MKKASYIILPIMAFFASFKMAYAADIEVFVANFLATIAEAIFAILGKFLIVLIDVLTYFAKYNDFVNAPAVVSGWVVVRDFCNMFFIVILLIIAFATILRIESYNVKKQLPKLIIMAILINFSKTISGVLIDISQVVMLTFVSAFAGVLGGNFTELLGITELANIDTGTTQEISSLSVFGAFVLALIYIVVSMLVILVIIATLVVRIVMLWVYVTLSPLAYLLAAFPQGKGYSAQWWDEFSKQLIIGPVLAFFLWLSFYAATINPDQGLLNNSDVQKENYDGAALKTRPPLNASITEAGSRNHMIKYIISIGMLIGGLQVAQKMGGVGGRAAGMGMGKIMGGAALGMALAKKGAKKAVVDPAKRTALATAKTGLGAARLVGGTMDRVAGQIVDKGAKVAGAKTNFRTSGLFAKTARDAWNTPGNVKNAIVGRFNKNSSLDEARRDFHENFTQDGTMVGGYSKQTLEHNGKKYKYDGSHFREADKDGNVAATASFLEKEGGGKVAAMGFAGAAAHDSWNRTRSKSRAVAHKAQEEQIGKVQQELANEKIPEGEMRRRMHDAATSVTEKMALALTLAANGGFKDLEDVKFARKTMGGNKFLQDKLNDDVDKKQAHLGYDFVNDASAKSRFKTRYDDGKIDAKKIDFGGSTGKDMMSALKEHLGDNFKPVIESSFKGGNASHQDNIAKALLENRDPSNPLINDPYAKMHAKLTGKVDESFGDNYGLDLPALQKFLQSAKPEEVNKIKVDIINNMTQNERESIARSFSYSKLKSMLKKGDNDDLVRVIRDEMKKVGKNKAEIDKDDELSTL